jgi:ATP-binding protein involved in chromosome partitioning
MTEKKLSDFMQQVPAVRGVKKIIAVASAKGGVGKSTIAANLAVTLKEQGLNVALVDADIYGPSIPHLMNLKGKPAQKDGLILPLMSHGVKCISIGSMVDANAAGIWRGPMVTKILYQLIRSVNWKNDGNEVDVMIIDMPPGTGDVYLSIGEKFPVSGVVIVSTPQSLAVIDVIKSIDCFEKLKIPILGLIQNMAYLETNGEKRFIFGEDGAKKLAKEKKITFLGDIPLIDEVSKLSDKKKIAVLKSANFAEIFRKISGGLSLGT